MDRPVTEYREPTAEECSARAPVQLTDTLSGWACWYPQMGGYASMAVIVPTAGGCSDVFVWHNGDFPFAGNDPPWPGEPVPSPSMLHHCSGDQFVAFGEFMLSLEDETGAGEETP